MTGAKAKTHRLELPGLEAKREGHYVTILTDSSGVTVTLKELAAIAHEFLSPEDVSGRD